MPWRWRGGGPSRSPTVHGGDKPQLCRAARHRATPRGALKRLRGLTTIALAGRSNGGGACRGRCSVPRWIGEPRRRHCFRRATRKARRACEIHADARRRDATLARNAVADVVRPSSSDDSSLSLSLPCRRAVPRGSFHAARASAPGDEGRGRGKCISLRRTGRPTSRCNQTPVRGGWRGREAQRRKRNWKHPRGRFATLLIRAARGSPVSILPSRPFAATQAPYLSAFSRVCPLTFASAGQR